MLKKPYSNSQQAASPDPASRDKTFKPLMSQRNEGAWELDWRRPAITYLEGFLRLLCDW